MLTTKSYLSKNRILKNILINHRCSLHRCFVNIQEILSRNIICNLSQNFMVILNELKNLDFALFYNLYNFKKLTMVVKVVVDCSNLLSSLGT